MPDNDKPAVIIPAHNEEASIGKLLQAIYPGVIENRYSVTVACNGCSDRTAAVVRHHFPEVQCLEVERAGKTHALNEAEALGLGFPRIYVDADVSISQGSLQHLIDKCDASAEPLVVAPRGFLHTAHSDHLVRIYYRAWTKTRFFSEYGYGAGVYALNRAAREAFALFPEIISDDGYIRARFGYRNIAVCEGARSQVSVPGNFMDLLRIKTRSKLGKLQLARQRDCRVPATRGISSFTSKPSPWELLVYYAVNLLAFANALRYRFRFTQYRWHRDESSRQAS
ncbi:glycosyltransferase [Microbulbifer bruguierae]|uniref:Glycosyltransferase n=1 Tax=Microbulbifer bruguierae TaxID=3029061 RepID=A0ABY8NH11_9GAMM|nr:glycosyltransferase [Microbulbifer bruguierae]WGL18225.1 glycosyltransferase [Microbulbifer bruguierae]